MRTLNAPVRPVVRSCRERGFTLLELAVVLAILGIVTAIAVPTFARMQRNSRFSTLINDLRVLTGAFQHYNSVNGGWPPLSLDAGVVPAGMQEFLRDTNWTKTTIFGGGYTWEQDVTHNGRKVRAAIALQPTENSPVRMTQVEMKMFDQLYDDGDLQTGFFQEGYLGLPLYVIEDDPAYVVAPDPSASDPAEVAAVADAKATADAAAAEQAAAEVAAAEQAKAEAKQALATAQQAAATGLDQAKTRYDDLVKWADKLNRNVPSNLNNRLSDSQQAVTALQKAEVDDKYLTTATQDVQDAAGALTNALDQFEKTLQTAQDEQDKKKN